ncbi:2-amino-4-hydroxy-6-hydroxymethyldihydropteridine diphosphokinase [endosymbiont of Ridgeia piscesae]|jgi:2-amino-4-hydroxy-6-hydroxymethyldihydropteridine diphosphokinase|uniref:2-amino-4-hydroxy-6-hydroxymethyldihydropteridine pyrophosphokinase n=1 Tax=endosymbiont of Ridgeia piscesae TaxID=54398 RepID=A0A0T5YXX6_9GAMM|nr:2-amino-4-hydroxy-6-hydroxymethyldihydropteridine diphosphokinase [endosymbiont of Ridgeia piscesae]KRT55504.1 2-amino-4-hydroxy-6-hydroxymethyldihydropteridine diphosphokinase [endosymbiont of Ridgeia piscesae]KRT58238.1 2-amino-4-hydroxy-6-hydroxymethyldihydropteridine diphosphokinase [endosymbiont of Ridgeia piscesae]
MAEPAPRSVYIALGSNLADPEAQIRCAFDELDRLPGSSLTSHSSLYRSRPLGPPDQPDYINAVILLRTTLSPQALLDQTQAIEAAHQRRWDGERWGPRTLDLDLLLYADRVVQTDRLQIPHPEMTQRAFVLLPLAEVAPAGLVIPGAGSLQALLQHISRDGLQRL